VPTDGSAIGNRALLTRLNQAAGASVAVTDYFRIRDALVAEGILATGCGRGGSVRLSPSNPPEVTSPESETGDDFGLEVQPPPDPAGTAPKPTRKGAAPRRSGKPPARQVISYRYDDKRPNNPHVGMVDTSSDGVEEERVWANRLIAGDSLLVMNSLLQKESLAGQVQMIYIDPPYGIRYGSNFQPFVNRRDVKDHKDEDLTQEPEMIKAFRDTWELGIHSYLTYLRDRLLLARELLSESGSIFVQISDENTHLIRSLLDEVFGVSNWCGDIRVVKHRGKPMKISRL
jgi:hypothetical protein